MQLPSFEHLACYSETPYVLWSRSQVHWNRSTS
uniref:Uncharacterized protein n=1 Tax=Arundo donax TaxID=35708 RepID=A0A0A8ZK94_ARUDO